jgi:hypothetical protein
VRANQKTFFFVRGNRQDETRHGRYHREQHQARY